MLRGTENLMLRYGDMQAIEVVRAVRQGCASYNAELTVELHLQQKLHEDCSMLDLCILRAS